MIYLDPGMCYEHKPHPSFSHFYENLRSERIFLTKNHNFFLSKHRKANQGRTEIIRNDLNPVWNYKTVFSIFRKNIQIQIQVKEWAKNLILYTVWTIV